MMTTLKKSGILCITIPTMILLGSSAFAGPTLTFGPDDEGIVTFEYKSQFSLTSRDTGSGADGDGSTSTFNFRRQRFALMGAYGENFSLYINTDYSENENMTAFEVTDGGDDSFRVMDAVLRYKVNDMLNFWGGKFKYSLTRENLEACEKPLTLDRSVLIHGPWDKYSISRDDGVAVWGNFLDDKLQYKLNVMEGRSEASKSPESEFRYGGRVHVTLLDPEKGHGYQGTYMGKKKVLTIGAGYQFENDVAFEDTVSRTGSIDFSAWTTDLYFEYPLEDIGIFTFSTAYTDYDMDDAITKSADFDPQTGNLNGQKDGYYAKVGYMLPNIPLQFFARVENWTIAEYDGVLDQEIDWVGGGTNYYFRGQNLKITLEYHTTDFDKKSTKAVDTDTVTAQLQVIF